jgi:hypothetical protein
MYSQLLGKQKSGGSRFKAISGKKLAKPYLKEQVGMVVHTCKSQLHGRHGRKTVVQVSPGQKGQNSEK